MSRVFFTADTHFGHSNIIKYCSRPFLSSEDKRVLENFNGIWHDRNCLCANCNGNHRVSQESLKIMDDTLIDNINKVVGENDTLWHLGDFCFGVRHQELQKAKQYRDRIKCKDIRIVWGNHDKPNLIYKLFNYNYDIADVEVYGQKIFMCHYSCAIHKDNHKGSWHLYGHSHAKAETWLDENMPGRKSIDVGVDNAALVLGEYRPFSFEELSRIMERRSGFFVDHHTSKSRN